MKLIFSLIALPALLCAHAVAAQAKPLKVFILAGQSNMEGHAKVACSPKIDPGVMRDGGAEAPPDSQNEA